MGSMEWAYVSTPHALGTEMKLHDSNLKEKCSEQVGFLKDI